MKSSELKKQARDALQNRWGYAVLITVIVGIVNMIPNFIESMLSGGVNVVTSQNEPAYSQVIGNLLTLFLIPMSIGYSWYFLEVSRRTTPRWTTVFEPFDISIYLKMLGASLLVALYTVLWSLLLIVPGIIKGFSYSQTMFILKDQPDLKVNQAITKSRQLMDGHKREYFVFILSFIGWFVLSLITFGFGFLWLSPYFYTSSACFYNQLLKKDKLD